MAPLGASMRTNTTASSSVPEQSGPKSNPAPAQHPTRPSGDVAEVVPEGQEKLASTPLAHSTNLQRRTGSDDVIERVASTTQPKVSAPA